jgi:chaperonin GroES
MSFKIDQVNPRGDRVLIKLDKPEEKRSLGGIIIPTSKKEEYRSGVVLKVGPGRKFQYQKEDGVIVEVFEPTTIQVSAKAILPLRIGLNFTLEDGEEYVVVKENEIAMDI